ncbi:Oxysterol-binding protein-related protein 1 [Liparis tanakae]|uniref:Oxysterol-binding protein-related protein 1 n=1 Tax=Liparis tanakae TaxID=230148 RepID=A0A4Z2FLQ7_9TELE|nr:Oxysterol-binding protein-related protein 1 [Liparis tanakae]
MALVLRGDARRGTTRHVRKYEGLLWKSSRFFGWRSYWVVLQDGVLSWYSKQSDAAANGKRQGCKSLTNAQCLIRAKDSCFFTLKCFDDSMHHFKVSPKNDPDATAKGWLAAVEEHSAYSTHYCAHEQGSEEEEEEEEEEAAAKALGELTDSLQEAQNKQKKLEEEVEAFLSLLRSDGLAERFPSSVTQKLQEVVDLSGETSSGLAVCLGLLSRREAVSVLLLSLSFSCQTSFRPLLFRTSL